MPGKKIYCKDCEKEKKTIETGGSLEVVSCTPLPDQDNITEENRKCWIEWKPKPI